MEKGGEGGGKMRGLKLAEEEEEEEEKAQGVLLFFRQECETDVSVTSVCFNYDVC